MLDKKTLKPAAEIAFVKGMGDLVGFLAGKCWDCNLETHLNQINDLISAAFTMEVIDEESLFSQDKLAELKADLMTLRTLKMEEEAKKHIIKTLVENGLPATVFASRGKDSMEA